MSKPANWDNNRSVYLPNYLPSLCQNLRVSSKDRAVNKIYIVIGPLRAYSAVEETEWGSYSLKWKICNGDLWLKKVENGNFSISQSVSVLYIVKVFLAFHI